MRRLITLIIAAAFAGSALAADPYAREQQEMRRLAYGEARVVFLARVEMVYHAYKCGVFNNEVDFNGLFRLWAWELAQHDVPGLEWPPHDQALTDDTVAAGNRGMALAQESCAKWRDNPRLVYMLRRLAGVAR